MRDIYEDMYSESKDENNCIKKLKPKDCNICLRY